MLDDAMGFNDKATNKNVGSIVLEIKLIKRTEVYGLNKVREPPNVIRGHRQAGDVCVKLVPKDSLRPAYMLTPMLGMEKPGPRLNSNRLGRFDLTILNLLALS